MNVSLERLESLGVSVWLDDLGRERIDAGELQQLVDDGIKGVTTNPSIFAAALSKGTAYDARISQLRNEPPDAALDQLMVADVHDACDVLAPVFEATGRVDGRVSSRWTPALPRHRIDDRGGQAPLVRGRQAQPDGQDPCDARGI